MKNTALTPFEMWVKIDRLMNSLPLGSYARKALRPQWVAHLHLIDISSVLRCSPAPTLKETWTDSSTGC